ncbi:hypothetical protein OXX59_000640 [Metschnikowia pulcherrima]
MIEFASAKSTHSSIGTTPFFANYGFFSRFVISLPEPHWREKNAQRTRDMTLESHGNAHESQSRVISENAYELVFPTHLRSSRQSKAYNGNSLKPFVPLTAEFERLPPLSAAEIVERAFELTAISDVTAETVHTHWADTSISCTISLQDYEQLPLAKRLALENAYISRVPPEQAFHSVFRSNKLSTPIAAHSKFLVRHCQTVVL